MIPEILDSLNLLAGSRSTPLKDTDPIGVCVCDNSLSKHAEGQKQRNLLKCTCYFSELVLFC